MHPPVIPHRTYLIGATEQEIQEYRDWIEYSVKYTTYVKDKNEKAGLSLGTLQTAAEQGIESLRQLIGSADMDSAVVKDFIDYCRLRSAVFLDTSGNVKNKVQKLGELSRRYDSSIRVFENLVFINKEI